MVLSKKALLLVVVFTALIVIPAKAGIYNEVSSSAYTNILWIPDQVRDDNMSINTHVVNFYEEKVFFKSVEKVKNIKPFENNIKGGIIPHHLFVSDFIAEFFKRLSLQKPKTIILLGPNHYEKGDFKALTSLYKWQTDFGVVEPKSQIIQKLIDNNLVKVDEEALVNDHAIGTIIPFIKYYLPDVKVVPVLLSGFLSEQESQKLAEELKIFIDQDTIILSSVDFSHYLTNTKAQENDKVTLQVLKSFDYQKLYSLNSDYLDSPASIGILLMLMQLLGTTNMEILHNTNSGQLQNNNLIPTTSYFSIAYF